MVVSIVYRLGRHHRDIESRFSDIREALSMLQGGIALVLFQIAAKKQIACMRAEQAVVFPRFASVAELDEDVVKARRQHQVIEESITQLRIGGLAGRAWNAELERLRSLVRGIIDLEELSMFPIVGLTFTPKQLVSIGVDFATHLAYSTPVAGASITYDMAPVAPRVVQSIPQIKLLGLGNLYEVVDLSGDEVLDLANEEVIDLATGEVIDPELDPDLDPDIEEIAYVFDDAAGV